MTREAGYTTRILTANAPTPTLSEYYHEHDLRHPAYHQGLTYEYAISRYKQFLPPSGPTYQPGPDHPSPPEAFMRSSHEIYHDEWIPRGSADLTSEGEEVENSLVYESDLDEPSSEGHGLPSSRSPSRLRRERQNQSQDDTPERQDTSNTAVSQPISGDTVVETQEHQQTTAVGRPTSLGGAAFIQGPHPRSRMDNPIILQSPSPVRLRRHSDTSFKNGRFVFPSGRLHASEDISERRPTCEKRTHRLVESSSPVIHPYVRCFFFLSSVC